MSITVKELKEWIATLDGEDSVAVDEGGLTLVVYSEADYSSDPFDGFSGPYLEVGGLPNTNETEEN